MMRAVSLRQPEADLIAQGKLRLFTRSWKTPYRGPLAIHAVDADFGQRPRRAIVGVGTLLDVINLDDIAGRATSRQQAKLVEVEGADLAQWAYLLGDHRRVNPAVPCTGRGSGAWTVPDDIEDVLVSLLAA
jgi:hypothetical protein